MDSIELTVIYDGPALKDGKIDINDLATALLGLGEIFTECNKELNGDSVNAYVNVKSGFKAGSWRMILELGQNFYSSSINALSGDFITSALNLVDIIGLIRGSTLTFGMIGLVKWIKNRKIKKTKRIGKRTFITVEDENGEETTEAPNEVAELIKNYKIRKGLEQVVKPLKKEGIEELKTDFLGKCDTIVKKEEVNFYDAPTDDGEKINETETTYFFSIRTLSFQEGNKWTLFDGTGQTLFNVKIKDREFLKRMHDNQEYFSEGDVLKVRLKTIQYTTAKGLKTEYEAIEILEHLISSKSHQIEFKDDQKD